MRILRETPAATLTIPGILAATNDNRTANQRGVLTLNEQLNAAAAAKAADLFAQQYFEHVGPDGRGPADWVDDTGYTYLSVGENLALGNFDSDADLVQAWMDSPGHRENILKTTYSEIGIGVAQGEFEGRTTWVAVQTFARPLSACPTPDPTLEAQFNVDKNAVTATNEILTERSNEISAKQTTLDQLAEEIQDLSDSGNQKIAEGNAKIAQGNATTDSDEAQSLWDEGLALQAAGQALLDDARTQQDQYTADLAQLQADVDSYNAQVTDLKAQEAALQTLIDQLNTQARQFNQCLTTPAS